MNRRHNDTMARHTRTMRDHDHSYDPIHDREGITMITKLCSRCGYNNTIVAVYMFSRKPLCESCANNEEKIGVKIDRKI